MYFPDLTPYTYGRAQLEPKTLNIGWLSAAQPFRRGVPNDRLVSALQSLALAPVNLYRGSHLCEFCPPPTAGIGASGLRMIEPLPGTTGNGEIRVVGADGVTYVAPVLILHYVVIHEYSPPEQFVEAVLRAHTTGTI